MKKSLNTAGAGIKRPSQPVNPVFKINSLVYLDSFWRKEATS
jgi:hypothetical protein